MNKYVSYCLYGGGKKYHIGAEKNILINNQLLPDWKTVIFYNSGEIPIVTVEKLKDLGAIMTDVKGCSFTSEIKYPMFWRYLIFENNVTAIVRDLDSRITPREVNYINNWINTDKKHFIIRDHPWHSQVPGGLFGIKNNNNFFNFFKTTLPTKNQDWGVDQVLLREYIQTIDKNDIFYCGFDDPVNYIKRDNQEFFIGMQLDGDDNPINPSAVVALQYLKDLSL